MITASSLSALVDEVLQEDPIDWGSLAVDEESSKNLIVLSMLELYEGMCKDNATDAELALLAMATKLALENFCLHLQLLQGQHR
jgi:hypothetical protein